MFRQCTPKIKCVFGSPACRLGMPGGFFCAFFHHFLRTVIHCLIIESIRVFEERGKTFEEAIELLQLLAYCNFTTYNNLSIW